MELPKDFQKKNEKGCIISLSKEGKIRNFPISIRNLTSEIIFENVPIFPNKTNKEHIETIIKNLEKGNSQILDKQINDFKAKITSIRYSTPIKNLLNDVIIIIREIIDNQGIFNVTHLTNKILKIGGLTTYISYNSIYQISRQIIDHLKITFPSLNIQRKKPSFNESARDKIRHSKITYTHKKLQEIAKENGGKLLTTLEEYNKLTEKKKPSSVKFKWVCDKYPEHDPFNSTPNNIKMGSWCKEHFKEKQKEWQISRIGYKYERLQDEAEKRGGQLKSSKDEYKKLIKNSKPSRAILRWHCGNIEHDIWKARPHDIIIGGKWCPECAYGKYERICGWYFTKIFRKKLPKRSLLSLNLKINKVKYLQMIGNTLLDNLLQYGHFDGYNEIYIYNKQYKIAFEYNGYQHYEFPNRYHNTIEEFNDVQTRDILKRFISEDNNVILIEFPYSISERMDEPKKIQEYIMEEFERKTGIKLPKMKQYVY
jgi:hypothetical protein